MPANTTLSTAAASGTVALAFIIVLQWLLSMDGIQIPADVATALSTLLTVPVHWFVTRAKQPPDSRP